MSPIWGKVGAMGSRFSPKMLACSSMWQKMRGTAEQLKEIENLRTRTLTAWKGAVNLKSCFWVRVQNWSCCFLFDRTKSQVRSVSTKFPPPHPCTQPPAGAPGEGWWWHVHHCPSNTGNEVPLFAHAIWYFFGKRNLFFWGGGQKFRTKSDPNLLSFPIL